jgi:hypothetical protein
MEDTDGTLLTIIRVAGVKVSIVPFQGVDPGSIPGRRNSFRTFPYSLLELFPVLPNQLHGKFLVLPAPSCEEVMLAHIISVVNDLVA